MQAVEQTWTYDMGLRVEFRTEVPCFTTTTCPCQRMCGDWVLCGDADVLKFVGEREAAALSVLSQSGLVFCAQYHVEHRDSSLSC